MFRTISTVVTSFSTPSIPLRASAGAGDVIRVAVLALLDTRTFPERAGGRRVSKQPKWGPNGPGEGDDRCIGAGILRFTLGSP